MTQLLVSVRNAAEAEAALRGGAALIDVKEPSRGPLGKADDAVIEEVVRCVAGRVPVSAAMGELRDGPGMTTRLDGLSFIKWGTAEYVTPDWEDELTFMTRVTTRRAPACEVVTVAYADTVRTRMAPPVEAVCAFARQRPQGVLLFDTWEKVRPTPEERRPTLLEWIPLPRLIMICRLCRNAGVRVALAGSLTAEEIPRLLPAEPDWIAVRGAACEGGREGTVSEDKVRDLAALLKGPGHGS
jgi:uncharacterized protein (UPF0264 family)